ncbi:HAMP domain-containing sensor histidine kinase [Ruminococcus sp.]|uniref:sensor histidine kinase n=1 Tax=Ruminococcus sp. TaxID=41978 RepID=UPI001B42F6F3|nr:HAMP domain-containing sensor histidine kinase [Ruminococcus sp.]MBP5433500.1 HAMP domain-containing histidine kinase [Ruminococcus sp.]
MLKRLKIKFVIVIMSIVTLFFGASFGIVMHLTKQNIERESIQMMNAMQFRPPFSPQQQRKPNDIPDNIRLPFFTVTVSEDGSFKAVGSDYYDLTDDKMLSTLMDFVRSSDKQVGMIPEYDLRYMKSARDVPESVVFADISSEKAMIRGLIRNFIITGLIGYAVFFVISLLLAKWVTKPVEKTWNEQKQFIADASHELKTPITVIMTNAEMLSDKSYTQSDREGFTKNILSTTKRMRGLVESLLELARLDNNRTAMIKEIIDYSKLINNCLLPFEPLFYENDMELSSDIDEDIRVEGDKDKLRQVVTILLDNALKYCDKEQPVTVKLRRQSAHCLLSVSGKGSPLSKADCENIFKRFYRVDPSRNDGHSYGLGLSIAESIISEHGGRIWAESENGYNTFWVSLAEK